MKCCLCTKCSTLMDMIESITLYSGPDMKFFWCSDCYLAHEKELESRYKEKQAQKDLNTKEIVN